MANRTTTIIGRKSFGIWTTSALLFTAVGCGFPHGRYGGDPMFGNFNRPITSTPPIYTGGNPGVSPAWDAGSRMGLPSPDVPAKSNSVLERSFIMPTFSGSLGIGNVFGGSSSSSSGGVSNAGKGGGGIERVRGSSKAPPRKAGPEYAGAHLAQPAPTPQFGYVPPAPMKPTLNSVTPRPLDTQAYLVNGSAIVPPLPPKPYSNKVFVKDPRSVASVEEGQSILQTCGARSMMWERQPTGEMRFQCIIGDGPEQRTYEAVNSEQIDAVRAVMWQVKNER
jgi:hypothetical protein